MVSWRDWPIRKLKKDEIASLFWTLPKKPEKIYYRGNGDLKNFQKSVTIVGSRKMTHYGEIVIERLVSFLVKNKISIISGFMYGVDTKSHQTCLELKGNTMAVVGGGLDQIANTSNEKLYLNILENGGLVMSEYEPQFKPTVWSFPQRDRLMASLCSMGVVVIEGGIKSGSLITADWAKRLGKPVMAVPGPITSLVSEGTNWLIKSGVAKMITCAEDIIGEKVNQPSLFKDFSSLSKTERMIIDVLENEEISIDDLCQKLDMGVVEVSTNLSSLILRDLVEEKNGKFYLS